VTPANCSTYPSTNSPVSFTGGPVGSSGGTLWVSYQPSPMSQWIASVNNAASNPNNVGGQLENFVKAYTKEPTPIGVPSSQQDSSGKYIPSIVNWGSPLYNGTFYPTPPVQVAGYPNRWTIVFNLVLASDVFPPYFPTTSNFLCLHTDSASAWQVRDISNSGTNGGTDIVFNDMVWINVGRGKFHGVTGAQILNSGISRDKTTYADNQLPCFSSESGGPQFADGLTDPVTYGNLVSNFTADSTADDSIAMNNDVGGTPNPQGGTYPLTSILNSTLTSADGHPIRLLNNSAISGLRDIGNTNLLDTGNYPYTGSGNGSPVYVDTYTQNIINATPSNCDTYLWNTVAGNGCPLYYDYEGYTGLMNYYP
jgi:hypothetical protein